MWTGYCPHRARQKKMHWAVLPCKDVSECYQLPVEYDKKLVRRLIEKVTVNEGRFTVEFKVMVDVEG